MSLDQAIMEAIDRDARQFYLLFERLKKHPELRNASEPDRVLDRALQRLRRAGRISYANRYWARRAAEQEAPK